MRLFLTLLLMSGSAVSQAVPDLATVLQRGGTLVAAGRFADAQEFYEKAAEYFPSDPDLRFELGMLYFHQKNWTKAVENFNSSLSRAPKRVKTLFYLAEAYFMEPDREAARETIAQAAAIAPNDAQVCQKYGEFLSSTIDTRRQGLEWLQKSRQLNPGLGRVDFEIGKTQYELTDLQSAKASLESALRKNPDDGEAAFYLAESAVSLAEWEQARDKYRYALTHGYENGPTYYGLGRSLVELGDPADALDPLQRALAVQPSLLKAHFQLGRAYGQLGRTQDAKHEAKLFSAMSDRVDTSHELQSPELIQAWKQIKPLLLQDKEQQALDLLAKLPTDEESEISEPHYRLGGMYFSLGRKDDAKRLLLIARNRAPESARIAAYLGMVELSTGDAAPAEGSFRAALSLNSGEVLALIGLGGIRYQQGQWREAADYLEKSRTADPGTLYILCDAYFRIGRNEDAVLIAEVIRAFGADQPQIIEQLDELLKSHQRQR